MPWLTVSGQVNITAAANPTASTRFGFVTVGARRITVSQLGTNAATATASVVGAARTVPVAEFPSFGLLTPARVSDVLVSISPLNFPVSTRAEITAAFDGRVAPDAINGSETTALLLANGAGESPGNPIQIGVNAFAGKLLDPDSIRWSGVPIGNLQTSATNGVLRLKLSRLRTNGSTVAIDLQSSAPIGMTNANVPFTVGIRNPAAVTASVGTPTLLPGFGNDDYLIPITLTETSGTAFAATEGTGAATSPGTRFLVTGSLPFGAFAQVSSTNGNAQLVNADFQGLGGDYIAGEAQFGGQYSQINDISVTWQVKSANDAVNESLVLRLLLTDTTLADAQIVANSLVAQPAPQYGEITPISSSDLEVTVDSIAVVGSNQRITYRVSNTELPNELATSPAVIRGNAGPGYAFASCSRSDGVACSFSGDTLENDVPDFLGGTTITFQVELTPTVDIPDGTYVESSLKAISIVEESDLSDNEGVAGFIKQACSPLTPASASFGAAGGTGGVNVPNCFIWSASSNVNWITVTSPVNNFAPGQVQYTVQPYTGATNRTGSLTIAGFRFDVTQRAACTFTVQPVSQTIAGTGGGANFSLTTGGQDCAWTITSDAAWLSPSPSTGLNSRIVTATAAASNTLSQRTGRLTVRETGVSGGPSGVYTVNQQPGPSCTLALSTTSVSTGAAAGSGTFNVNAAGLGCSWSLSESADWLTLAPAAGTAGATITYTTTANASPNSRSATIRLIQSGVATPVATLTLTQGDPGCVTVLAAPGPIPYTGQSGSIAVTATTANCSWTASSSATWLEVYPLTGTGTKTVTYKVYPNFGTKTRTATITIGTRTVAVTQSGNTSEAVLRRFIRLLYFSFLGRGAGEQEVQQWVNTGASRGVLAKGFLNSPEFNLGGRFVAGLYIGLLNRDPEFTGWQFQRDSVRSGAIQPCALVSNFINSEEFRQQHPGISDDEYIRLLYRQILLREASNGEVAFHRGTLPSLGRDGVACNFLNAPEFRQAIGPRLTAFLLYATLLLRDGSPGERASVAQVIAQNPAALDGLLEVFANGGEIAILLE